MNVTLCSHFRNATPYIWQYMEQVTSLGALLNGRLHLVLCEGDSSDETYTALCELTPLPIKYDCFTADIFQYHHGGQDYGSVVHPERFANLSKVCNAIWQRLPADADAVVWMESDLVWEPATVLALLDRLADFPVIAPMILLDRAPYAPGFFYDSWAARKDGRHIGTAPPYFPGWDMQAPIQVDSMGSCLVMRGDVARGVSWPSEDVVVGICRQIREQGGSVWLDPNLQVTHL